MTNRRELEERPRPVRPHEHNFVQFTSNEQVQGLFCTKCGETRKLEFSS